MSKNIIIKFVILLVVCALVYSVFWFFKIGQVEKQVNKFISENGAYVSAGEVSVSGFPMSQKITIKDLKFTIPTPLLNKRQTVVKQLEATAGIFSSDFSVALLGQVTVQDIDNNSANVEFSKDPVISASIAEGLIAKFNYQDFGYRILDAEKNVIYAASSSTIALESVVGDAAKITTKITANVKDIEGFDVLNIYKNVFEKKVVEGIKTGEIVIGSTPDAAAPVQLDAAGQPVVATDSAAVSAPTPAPAASAVANAAAPAADPNAAKPADAAVAAEATNAEAVKPEESAIAAADSSLVKNNLTLEIEYILTPVQSEQQAQVPTDPTQIQEMPLQFSKIVKVTNLEFSNPLYKILLNGEMNVFQDDNMPSGSIAVKVEKIDALIGHVATGFGKMVDQAKPVADVQSSDLTTSVVPTEDSYQVFLKKVAANLNVVAKELAAKNAISKDDIAEFDIRREKNLEFLINETSFREILGKF